MAHFRLQRDRSTRRVFRRDSRLFNIRRWEDRRSHLLNLPVNSFTTTAATPEDSAQCADLLVAQLAEHNVHRASNQLMPVIQQVIANPQLGFILVARQSDRIIGLAYAAALLSAEYCGLTASLEELYVLPEFRSLGVGSALLTAVIEKATERQMTAIQLEVDVTHMRAANLYKRLNFRRLDRSRWLLNLSDEFHKKADS